jgi:hypothetical protein
VKNTYLVKPEKNEKAGKNKKTNWFWRGLICNVFLRSRAFP